MMPLAVVGALSRFQEAASDVYQQAFTMLWLGFGIYLGPWLADASKNFDLGIIVDGIGTGQLSYNTGLYIKKLSEQADAFGYVYIFYVVPPIGGMVVAMMMMAEFGVCRHI
ncbi:hypothetical protein MCOR25_002149 [Pyricularia grisea]|nr:hypothetical protein MCOR25_002149 [Pyricularia grisea]